MLEKIGMKPLTFVRVATAQPMVHLSNVEYPAEFIEAVLDFLR